MTNKAVLMVAAENDALPRAKVGGIGDVIRDLPLALAAQNCTVHTILPSYGFLHELPGAAHVAHFPVAFAGELMDVALYQLGDEALKPGAAHANVHHWVLHHARLAPCGKSVYCNDGSDRPFATDATKYAFFCAGVAEAVMHNVFGHLDALHLHDWHAAFLALLREYDPHCRKLKALPTVYTIHNLALQGVRPFDGDPSSLGEWFPALTVDKSVVCDPRYSHCINPVRAAINLVDKIHAVSPSYAAEIQMPSRAQQLVYGGEGLECDLRAAAGEGRLFGILNGCEYPDKPPAAKLSKTKLAGEIWHALLAWIAREPIMQSAHWLAEQRLKQWLDKKERGLLLTSVGRVTEQKVALMMRPCCIKGVTQSALDHILTATHKNAFCILLGTGDPHYESFLREVSARHVNFLFLQGYSEVLANALYATGDLFMMPSSFEPCGISQMLAMRAGQPCVVNAVGGLKDTVRHDDTGFVFAGDDGDAQALAFVATTLHAVTLARDDPERFKVLGKNAASARFLWADIAAEYLRQLYA